MIRLTFNDKKVQAPEGMTLLELARREKVLVPGLCYHPAVKPLGSCRLCLVEIREARENYSDLFTSCNYPVKEDIAVWTGSPRVLKARALIFELLLARSPSSSELRQLAASYGVTSSRFTFANVQDEKCILCGLCVRVCQDLIQKNAINMAYRGPDCRVVASHKGPSPDCIGCAACAFVCPTGAVQADREGNRLRLSPWKTDLPLKTCSHCGDLFAVEKTVEHIKSRFELAGEKESLCSGCRRQEAVRTLEGLMK